MATMQESLPVHKSQQSLFAMNEDQIHEKIFETHVHGDTQCDVDSLFNLAASILGHSTHIVDDVVQGKKELDDNIIGKTHAPPSFSSPLCILKEISFEMSCKEPCEEISYSTTLAILKKLSHFEWDAKAVLTLAAFAFEYGEFWLLYQLQEANPLAKSLAELKKVPVLTRPATIKNHSQAIAELNNLIKKTLQVIELVYKLEKLNHTYGIKRVPALGPLFTNIPIDVFWVITTIVAVVTQINCLTEDSKQSQELSRYYSKIDTTLCRLKSQFADCQPQIQEADYIAQIYRYLEGPTEILRLIKLLIFHDTPDAQQLLFDGTTSKTVNVDVLKSKNIFLFISTLDITDDEISVVTQLGDRIKNEDQFKIVWIPLEERWNDAKLKDHYEKKFEEAKKKMKWYVVQQSGFRVGCKYIKEEWHFNKQPMVVTISPRSKILHDNAFHMIQAYGSIAFPCTRETEKKLHEESTWNIKKYVEDFIPDIPTWIKQGKYIFFYGGNNEDLLRKLNKCAMALQELLKKANISIELCSIQSQKEDRQTSFWNGIESLFITKMQQTTNIVTQEVQKMLSYRYETGWALLTKGPAVVLTGHGVSITETVEEYQKVDLEQIKVEFVNSFKKTHREVEKKAGSRLCSHVQIPIATVKNPEPIHCPMCPRTMKVFISYKCCHNDGSHGTVAAPIDGEHDTSMKQE